MIGQVFAAGIGAALAAFGFSKLSPRNQTIVGMASIAIAVGVVIYAVSVFIQ